MRYYIEARGKYNRVILGNLDGQAALGEVRQPFRCKAVQELNKRQCSPRVSHWVVIDESGRAVGAVIQNRRGL